ncbi:MAG TPA: ABC transporter substrate-binding protein [Chthoniobacterales bacterium]
MKRLLTFGAAVLLGATSTQAETIAWWLPNWDEKPARAIVADYETANPGEKVEIVITTWDTMAQKILVGLQSRNAPDVITELESRTLRYARKGLLADLTGVVTELGKDDFVPSALATGEYEGRYYSVPFRHDGAGLYYNKDLFAAAGLDPERPPQTWAQLVEYCKKLTVTKDGTTTQYGIAWPLGNVNNGVERYLPLLYDHGGKLFNQDQTRFTLDTPEAIGALDAMANLFKTGVAPMSSLEVDNTGLRELFLNRRIAMYYSGPFDVQPILEAGIKVGTGVLPGLNGMGVTTVDGFSLIVPAHSSKQKAAEQFVAFVGQPKNQARLTATFPPSYTALKYEQFSSPYLQPFIVQLGRVENMPNHPKWNELERILFDNIQAAVLGKKTSAQAMADANAQMNGSL